MKFNFSRLILSFIIAFISLATVCIIMHAVSLLSKDIQLYLYTVLIGGIFSTIAIYAFLDARAEDKNEEVYIIYRVNDETDEVSVVAVCDNKYDTDALMEEYDCYRVIELNKVIPNADWEDLIYKTPMGNMTAK